ncbi:MAG: SelB C-terminal domain-containing protein, partial [Solirubrobacterales bacterium]
SDLVDDLTLELAVEEVRELLPSASVVPVSARSGAGIDELRARLATAADDAEAARRAATVSDWSDPPILHVDRAFSLHGIGTVVTGTLQRSSLAMDDRIAIVSRGSEARIRSLQVHDEAVERAEPGQRVALNLAGVSLSEISRGDVISSTESGIQASYRLDVEPQATDGVRDDLGGKRIQVHQGTRDVPARAVQLDDAGRFLQLRLSSPLYAVPGDRVVFRQIAPPDTLGGGLVVDSRPPRHGYGAGAERLELLLEGGPREVLSEAVATGALPSDPQHWHTHPVTSAALSRFSREEWEAAVTQMLDDNELAIRGTSLVVAEDAGGASGESEAHPVILGEREIAALDLLRGDGPAPRSPQAIADELAVERTEADAILERLVGANEARRVGPSLFYESDALDQLTEEVVRLAGRREGSISLAELRDDLGTSRKYAQAVLEHLDGEKLTVRRGERHYVRGEGD